LIVGALVESFLSLSRLAIKYSSSSSSLAKAFSLASSDGRGVLDSLTGILELSFDRVMSYSVNFVKNAIINTLFRLKWLFKN